MRGLGGLLDAVFNGRRRVGGKQRGGVFIDVTIVNSDARGQASRMRVNECRYHDVGE